MLKYLTLFIVTFSLVSPVAQAKDWSKPSGGASTTLTKDLKAKFDQFVFRREFKKIWFLQSEMFLLGKV